MCSRPTLAIALALLLGPTGVAAQAIPIVFVKVSEVHGLLGRSTPPVLVDVRSREEYQARHIKGAVSIPLNEVVQRVAEIPRYPLVVLY
jgi:hypothetical protein